MPALLLLAACAAAPVPAPASLVLDGMCEPWKRADAPGFVLALVREGRVVEARGCGLANLEHAVANAPDTVFDIGSTSKQFTAACVGLLQQDGRLSVADDLRRWVPEIPDYGRTITLDHLLHHTSGLRDYLTLFALAGIASEDLTGDRETLAMLARQKELNFEPGSEHLYSNSGYFLLSLVVRRASGQSLADFARARIFEPLGMRDTHVHDDHTRIVERRATGYVPRADGSFAIDMSDFEQTGDGAVMTTVIDLAKWDENFHDPRVGGPALLEFLRGRGRLADGRELDYARGLVLGAHEGLGFESHGGAWAGYRAQLLRFPAERVSVICLANRGDFDPSALCWQAAALALGDALAPRPASARRDAGAEAPAPRPVAAPCEGLAGRYDSEELAVRYEIAGEPGAWSIGIVGEETLPLQQEGIDQLEVQGAGLRVQRDSAGAVTGFLLDAGRVRNLRFVRVR